MMTVVAFLVFAATLATSVAVIAYTLRPAMPRIIALLAGREDVGALPHLVLRDRRPQPRVRVLVQPNRVHRAAA